MKQSFTLSLPKISLLAAMTIKVRCVCRDSYIWQH